MRRALLKLSLATLLPASAALLTPSGAEAATL